VVSGSGEMREGGTRKEEEGMERNEGTKDGSKKRVWLSMVSRVCCVCSLSTCLFRADSAMSCFLWSLLCVWGDGDTRCHVGCSLDEPCPSVASCLAAKSKTEDWKEGEVVECTRINCAGTYTIRQDRHPAIDTD